MQSILSETFPSLDDLAAALAPAIQTYPYEAVETGDGIEIRLPHRPPLAWPSHDHRFSRKKKRNRLGYEPVTTALFDFVIDSAEITSIYDIGAHMGYFGFIGAARDDKPAETHCFEMRSDYHARMQELAARHGLEHMHPHLSGMSDIARGEVDIWWSLTKMYESEPPPSAYRDSWHRRIKFWLRGTHNRDRLTKTRVTIESIDAFTQKHGLAPGLLKIDVDGYEGKVLSGGMTTLRTHRPVILLELHNSRFLRPHGTDRHSVMKLLFDMGYEAIMFSDHYDIRANEIRPVRLDSPEIRREQTDFFMMV